MAVAEARLLPVSPNARRKSDGTPYTPEDREAVSVIIDGHSQTIQRVPYFELVQHGGIRQYEARYFPCTVFQAYSDASTQGRVEVRTSIVQTEAEKDAARARGWYGHPDEARDALEGSAQAVARAAAETAYAAERMSEPARRSHHKKSAESPDHVTE